MRVYML